MQSKNTCLRTKRRHLEHYPGAVERSTFFGNALRDNIARDTRISSERLLRRRWRSCTSARWPLYQSRRAVHAKVVRFAGRQAIRQCKMHSFPELAAACTLQWCRVMPSSDRAFRALARSEPRVVLAVLRAVLPDFMPGLFLDAEAVEDPKLDLPSPLEADLIARAGPDELLHVEGQGYPDSTFEDRVFRYHLLLTLRHPERRVRTVALWFIRPRARQRLDRIQHRGVSIEVQTIVLPDVPASRLLADPDAVCFASGANAEGRSDNELCRLVASALRQQNAGGLRLLISAVVAAAAGRYDAMIKAMTEAKLDPPIIEDLVLFGRERGLREGIELGIEQGIQEGIQQGIRQGIQQGAAAAKATAILDVLETRALAVTAAQRERIRACTDLETLTCWLRRAVTAVAADELFE